MRLVERRFDLVEREIAKLRAAEAEVGEPEQRVAVRVQLARQPCRGAHRIEELGQRTLVLRIAASLSAQRRAKLGGKQAPAPATLSQFALPILLAHDSSSSPRKPHPAPESGVGGEEALEGPRQGRGAPEGRQRRGRVAPRPSGPRRARRPSRLPRPDQQRRRASAPSASRSASDRHRQAGTRHTARRREAA